MKFKLICLLLVLGISTVKAQLPSSDQVATSKGPLLIKPIQHASVVFTWNNKTIYVDPTGGMELYKGMAAPDLILITDIHGDHFDQKTLAAVNTANAILVVPQAVADMLPAGAAKDKATVIRNGDKISISGVEIAAIPMYNLPESATARHTKGRGNGYVLGLGGKNIYLSGDTQGIPEMLALKNIDAAFLCMNLPYTMDINEASKAVLVFKPKIVYPYHYRGQDTEAFKKLVNDGDKNIDVRLLAWYPAPVK